MHDYPAEFAIVPLTAAPSATVTVPGSKSITNRALVLAALTPMDVPLRLTGALLSEDTEVMVAALQALGYAVEPHWDAAEPYVWFPYQERATVPATEADLFVANSGTTVRFLTALVAAGRGRYRLDGIPRMRERPIRDLLDALNQLRGVRATSEAGNGCPPVVIESDGVCTGQRVTVRAGVSSQFLSGLLMAAPHYAGDAEPVEIEVVGPTVSEPYIAMTLAMMRQWGYEVEAVGNVYRVPAASLHNLANYAIEPDASAASYFWAAAAVAGGRVTVAGLTRQSLQGDVRFVDVLAQMGCRVEECDSGITVHGGRLRGVDVDMNDISDTVMTLGAVALFADGPTTIRNVAHIRHKETDRIAALATELRKFGAAVAERDDGLTITPGPLRGAAVDTYNDHRMAMSLALVGLKVPGVVIRNPGCVAKTYPDFWRDLEALRRHEE
ncbi:3-phosphoshikimate 1-carboxyvinyltransferase [Urbifossiella limnaea]|uniref:3-phosphoshikimate 1-carboxyvinyltransferase n=1 Tax=Urbifossiella limnaea TaxID=2528023 RepID=A0A517XKZ9_9BACT|nr:3-phosphoshikimate 1-carboxyvinyltransferase [Urbifossiella limnaea]QDU18183.1 3-phosphoshikimate 1-carboxyvinyltransferase [Urbifossiella limnaea]